ncbi:zinc ribbon domain-containing protein [Anaerosphaera multitolerans]|uniref:Zinc ribbon domain-containing protein n=1 Tax=Anaerosphaera multitolerans TaxID=2487351 RepID=A0A437S8R2_9FIRM|nr:zinc ribbon domain-containing protein [Anaerosphaera multitolerans]RVU55489.1 zinc ribbon domain-containing protein [Anaerosphaera multitolerans]
MKKIKKGRGPSFLRFLGSIAAIIFGIFWTVLAFSLTTNLRSSEGTLKLIGYAFPLFGIVFILMGIFEAIYNYRNAVSKKRFSEYDIVEDDEEDDTFTLFSKNKKSQKERDRDPIYEEDYKHMDFENTSPGFQFKKYCTECGTPLEKDYKYCPECGKKI